MINKIFKKSVLRLGYYLKGNKKIPTPCYFLISNFGGGGTNVSRLVTYMHIFENGDTQLLLNYYYLNVDFKKTPGFDIKTLSTLNQKRNIIDFLKETRKDFITKKKVVPDYRFTETTWNPEIMLDSGSGNIFRDLIKEGKLSAKNFNEAYTKAIKEYISFGLKHKFDILIAMDIAEKYTQKQGEHNDDIYRDSLTIFKSRHNNIELLKITLENLPDEKGLMMFAPIHGRTPKEYEQYLETVLKVENEMGRKFAGFAIGGLGKNLRGKISYEICALIRNKLASINDNRPIHVLGIGSLQNLIPMCLLGVDSFDCHSPWRRASEGKFVVPLINSKGEIITNKSNFWDYILISRFDSEDFNCDCEVCRVYSLRDLKEIYNKGNEYAYFAKVLFFKHNISQQEFILKEIRKGRIEKLIKNIPESRYSEYLKSFVSNIN